MEHIEQELLTDMLDKLSGRGIAVDRSRLRKDICRQFPVYRLWIREFIVNAFDAGAKNCDITGTAEGDIQTITIKDDGSGMNKEQVKGFLMKFRSAKDNLEHAIGRFGIGSFSVAAIPGQCAFFVVTSTGKETWRFTVGSLLEGKPIVVERLHEVRPRGTTFDVSFYSNGESISTEMKALAELARKYVYHLPINVFFHIQSSPDLPGLLEAQWIPGNWLQEQDEYLSKRFCFQLEDKTYDVVLALGTSRQAIFQKRVLVSDERLDHSISRLDSSMKWADLPYLVIRIDSNSFDLPLGRHCLSNTDDLIPVADYIHSELFAQFTNSVIKAYQESSSEASTIQISMMEAFLCGYLALMPRLARSVNKVRLLRTHDGNRISFADLEAAVGSGQGIYLEDTSSSGLDYDVFDGHVLSHKQPGEALRFLMDFFGDKIINLTLSDLVQEAPEMIRGDLTDREKSFADALAIHPNAAEKFKVRGGKKEKRVGAPISDAISKTVKKQIATRATGAIKDLRNMTWRVSRLVKRDGYTPCTSVLYLYKNNMVTLNLHHTDIQNLVKLSESAPLLSAHFAVALCLSTSGKNSILPQLPSEDREDLLNLDAILRCGDENKVTAMEAEDENSLSADVIDDFNRNSTMNDLPF